MTDVINRISALKAKVDKQNKPAAGFVETRTISTQASSTDPHHKPTNNAQETVKPKQSALNTASAALVNPTGACGFGGMKKGFLAGGLENKKQANTANKPFDDTISCDNGTDMPHIKSNPSKVGDHLVMQEVQRMRDQLQKTGKL